MENMKKLCDEYRENRRLIEELTAMNEEIKAAIVAAMGEKEIVVVGSNKISNITVNSVRFDSTAFKKVYPALFTEYSKNTCYKRFTVV